MTRNLKHYLQIPALRLVILAAMILSLLSIGWIAHPSNTTIEPTAYTSRVRTVPAPTVTVTNRPKTVTKLVTKVVIKKVPGPVRTRTIVKYVSRSKTRVSPNTTHRAPSGVAACIRKWESGGNYSAENPVSTASGAYQFLDTTWQAVTGLSGRAKNYSPSTQDAAFYKLWAGGSGRSQWVTGYHC